MLKVAENGGERRRTRQTAQKAKKSEKSEKSENREKNCLNPKVRGSSGEKKVVQKMAARGSENPFFSRFSLFGLFGAFSAVLRLSPPVSAGSRRFSAGSPPFSAVLRRSPPFSLNPKP